MSKKGTIILDFLMFVITATVIAVAVITYLNIKEIKKSYMRELNTKVSDILFIFDNISENVNRENDEYFKNMAENIVKKNSSTIYSISIGKLSGDSELEIIDSTNKEENGKIENFNGIKKILERDKESARQIAIEKLQIYEYLRVVNDGRVLSIKISLQNAVNEFRKAFILNVAVAICAIIFMVGFTTYILLNKIYKPIQRLREEIKKIEDGEVAYELNLDVNNELNDLAHEINDMKDRLWEKSFSDKFSHPVTGLPGLITEIEYAADIIDRKEKFGIVNITIKNFENYILRAGLVKGEDYLRNLYNMIEECLAEKGVRGHRMFQTRENSIAIFTNAENAIDIGKAIAERFDSEFILNYEAIAVDKSENIDTDIKIKNIKGEEIEYPCTRLMITVILNTAEEQVEGYREIEGRILKTETLYNGVKGKSYCIVSGKEENEVMNEEPAKEDVKTAEEDDLLAGLDEIDK